MTPRFWLGQDLMFPGFGAKGGSVFLAVVHPFDKEQQSPVTTPGWKS